MDSPEDVLTFRYNRRFGTEIELNSFDRRNFRENPLARRELPQGIHYVGNLLADFLGEKVTINRWRVRASQNNPNWVVKTDASCGIEICSPVSQGWYGLKRICQVVDLLGRDTQVEVGEDCSFHLHAEVRDLNDLQMGSVLAHWIKCEPIFLDSVPFPRKRNRYCQCIGQSQFFSHERLPSPGNLIGFLSDKYYTANTYQWVTIGDRRTLEFRPMGAEGCLDAYLVKNWIKLLLHFVERTKDRPYPEKYRRGDKWTGLLWLDLADVMELLGFTEGCMSKGMEQTRNWFLARLRKNLLAPADGIWSQEARRVSIEQLEMAIRAAGLDGDDMERYLWPNDENAMYGSEYKS